MLARARVARFAAVPALDGSPVPLFIHGQKVQSQTKEFVDVLNPATGAVIARTPIATADERVEALASCVSAQKEWAKVPVAVRSRKMFSLLEVLREAEDDVARIITAENGKTLGDSHGDIFRGQEVIEFACSSPALTQGESLYNVSRGVDTVSHRLPLGVVAGVTPFNFPFMCGAWMYPLAITAGNAFLLKPSELTPLTAVMAAELAHEAGVPAGVFNVLHGTHDAVNFICDEPAVRAISFVGSNAAGEHIYKRGAQTGKRMQCNMGAKNHVVIMPDANADAAVAAVAGASCGGNGQRCMAATTVIFVGEANRLVERVAEAIKSLRIGDGMDPSTQIGPLASAKGLARAEALIQSCADDGGRIVVDGRRPSPPAGGFEGGFWLAGSMLHGVTAEMQCYKQEIFAPVMCAMDAKTLDDAINIVNSNEYGNGASIFTRSGPAARKFVDEAAPGQIGVNVPIPVPLPQFSFTGNKRSMWGDLNFYGKAGLSFYQQWKTTTSNWNDASGVHAVDTAFPVLK